MRKFHIYQMTKSCANSWTHTLKSIAEHLSKSGVEVIYNLEGDKYSTPTDDDISISFTDPPRIKDIPGKNKYIIYTFETSILPPKWGKMINFSNCKILSPSSFCSNIFLENAIDKDKIVDVPLGVDKSIFYKDTKERMELTKKKFVFGTVSINHRRKGILELATAYLETFTTEDNVSLVIKTTELDTEPKFHEFDVKSEIEELKKKYKTPAEIVIVTNRLDSVRTFYNSIDVFVSASKSEGFFYPALEAMACEVPVICTRYGGQMDFLNPDNSYLINYVLRDATRGEQYWYNYKKGSKISEPDLHHLSRVMRHVYENYEEAIKKTQVGLETVDKFSWDNTIKKILAI